MAKIGQGGVSYRDDPVREAWEPTVHLAFFRIDNDALTPTLHQQWRSNCGRTRWRPIVEMDPHSPDNE
jgi:hypothetical protein